MLTFYREGSDGLGLFCFFRIWAKPYLNVCGAQYKISFFDLSLKHFGKHPKPICDLYFFFKSIYTIFKICPNNVGMCEGKSYTDSKWCARDVGNIKWAILLRVLWDKRLSTSKCYFEENYQNVLKGFFQNRCRAYKMSHIAESTLR